MSSFSGYGARLHEERENKKLTQAELGAVGNKTERAQQRYEKEENDPPLSYLANISKIGCDIQYIITGIRSTQALSDDEQALLSLYKKSDASIKTAAIAVLESGENE